MTTAELARRLRSGDRRALAQAITLAESARLEQRQRAEQLLGELLPYTGGAHRVAVTGPPGAGKSTLVDALGALELERGRRVAVLAIDPASAISRGSLLGDAVRMQRLAASATAFVRASSNAGTLGGAAPGTREAVLLCEAAGFETVLIETVGVGQAEQQAFDLCDTLLVLGIAGAGDEIQGMKRGLLEVADALIVNKADGAGLEAARAFASELSGALALLRPGSAPHVSALSAQTGDGVAELLDWLVAREARLRQSGALFERRKQQLGRALHAELARELSRRVAEKATSLLPKLEAAVQAGEELPSVAARQLLDELLR